MWHALHTATAKRMPNSVPPLTDVGPTMNQHLLLAGSGLVHYEKKARCVLPNHSGIQSI